jgi:hypothetical protein
VATPAADRRFSEAFRHPFLDRPGLPLADSRGMEYYELVDRVRSEFLEMPGLRLTPEQAARLWGLDSAACQNVIKALVASAFLRWTPSGMLVRTEH